MPPKRSARLLNISSVYGKNYFEKLENVRNFFRRHRFALLPTLLDSGTASNWADLCKNLLTKYGIHIERKVSGKRLSYTVVTGEIIRQHASEIYNFYRSRAMRNLIRWITGAGKIYASRHLRSSININYLHKPRHVYRWHFDAEPYSSILFLASLNREDGGALRIRPVEKGASKNSSNTVKTRRGRVISIKPEAGSLVIMDGTVCAHSVASLRKECNRITLAMVHPNVLGRPRPEKLDEYLYDNTVTDEEFHGDPNLPRR